MEQNNLSQKQSLIILGGATIVIFIVAIVWLFRSELPSPANTNEAELANQPPTLSGDGEINRTQSPTEEVMVPIVSIEGSLLMIAPDRTFVRIDAGEKGLLSIGISGETIVRVGGVEASVSNLPVLSALTIEAMPQDSGQMYDFVALTIDTAITRPTAELTEEERLERNMERVRSMNDIENIQTQ